MKDKLFFSLISGCCLALVFIFFMIYDYFFVPQYSIIGNKIELLEVNEDYKEKGIQIKYRGKILKNIEITNNINRSKAGEYVVTYKALLNNKIKKVATRKIEVIDLVAPSIKLAGDKLLTVNYKGTYQEPGYYAYDNSDENLTGKITISNNIDTQSMGEYYIKYEVSDSSGNTAFNKRKIIVKDIGAPTIKVNRNKTTYCPLGTTININDYKAIDNLDGDVTSKVIVEGNVNFNVPGTYKIKYTVSDEAKNVAILETTIIVYEKVFEGVPVLMYHFFYDNTNGETYSSDNSHNYMPKTSFEAQMKYLVDNNYYFPTWQELLDYIDNKAKLPEKSIIITDDDGNESFYRVALPILVKYNIPATSFVVAERDVWKSYISEKNLSFQSHSYSMHERTCSKAKNGAAMCANFDELNADTKLAIDIIGSNYAYAYPFGHYNDTLIDALKANDVKMAFTTESGKVKVGANKYKLPRVRISRTITIKEFASKL